MIYFVSYDVIGQIFSLLVLFSSSYFLTLLKNHSVHKRICIYMTSSIVGYHAG